ncbi:MAG: HDIG domain-containing metalloprotein [Bacillota bacterium]
MPPFEEHVKTSLKRTGKDYRMLHEWLDLDREFKAERHSLPNLKPNLDFVRTAWGEEGVAEFLHHVVEDKAGPDLAALRGAGCPEEAVEHSMAVARKALEIAARTGLDLDMALVFKGALYHDLGKAKTYGIEHGELGAAIALELGLDEAVVAIIRKHIRGGLTTAEAAELGLPALDYTLGTPEEKIVIYADRLADIICDPAGIVSGEQDAEDRFEEILRTYPKYGKNIATTGRYLDMHREIRAWTAGGE